MQIIFSPHDRLFATQLSSDLESRGLTVVLRERLEPATAPMEASEERQIIVISRSALDWPRRELETALPVVIDSVTLPEEIAGIKYANFAVSYESGLDQLLRSVWPASSRLLVERDDRQFACAFQGVAKASIPPHIGMIALAGDRWSFAAVIESVGDRALAPQLTTHLCDMLTKALQKLGVLGRNCLEPLLMWANLFARAFRIDMKLPLDFPLGAAIAAMAQFEDQTLAATVGTSGIFKKSWRNDSEIELVSFYSEHKRLRVPAMDNANAVVAFQAPLGFLDFEKDDQDWADCHEVRFSTPGDLVALATFRFPREPAKLNQVGLALTRSQDAVSSARVLTNTFAAAGRDAMCGVVCYNPA
jgi:hypothetical protein